MTENEALTDNDILAQEFTTSASQGNSKWCRQGVESAEAVCDENRTGRESPPHSETRCRLFQDNPILKLVTDARPSHLRGQGRSRRAGLTVALRTNG